MPNVSQVKRGAMAAVVGACLLLTGCGGNPQQLLQVVTGLLGGLTGIGNAGPLGGAIAGGLPQAPTGGFAGPVGGAAPAPAPQAPGSGLAPAGGTQTAAANDLGGKIKQAAYDLPDPFPYAPGTENGNLGCADVVSTALENAGAIDRSEHSLAVDGVASTLRGKGWQDINPPPYKDGDVIVWGPTSGGTHKHIGIIVIENGDVYAINNSSSQKRPIKILLSSYSRQVDTILRNPGA